MKRLVLALGLAAVAALSAACAASAPAPSVTGSVDPNGPTVVAKDMKFQTGSVEVKAGQNLTLHFDNEDQAPHNVAIFKDSSASSPISIGQVVSASKSDQVIPALAAGTYFFRCDVHHDMTGTIVAK
jgi:plastocyanin